MFIDAVITWVDGHDVSHRDKMRGFLENESTIKENNFRSRYDHVNEIEYSVKSILKYAKFIRNIYIVTDNQTPDFLRNKEKAKKEFPSVYIIDHKTIFKGYEKYLPTFNSMSIESLLYRIPNLSEHFIYLNDDFFMINKTKKTDFFINNKVVVRGVYTSFYEDIWYKILQNNLYKLLKKNKKINAFGFKKSQQLAAKKLGFKKYVRLDHTFTAIRKSVLEDFYSKNQSILEENIKYRFIEVQINF